jgi:hypothetical protein
LDANGLAIWRAGCYISNIIALPRLSSVTESVALPPQADEGGQMSDTHKFDLREWLVSPVLLPILFALLIAATVIIQRWSASVDIGRRESERLTEKASEWQTQQSSGTHTEFRPCSLVQKLAGMTLHLFLSGSEMRSAGCDGPNGMRFLLGLALGPLGRPEIDAREMEGNLAKEPKWASDLKRLRQPVSDRDTHVKVLAAPFNRDKAERARNISPTLR